MGTGPRRQPNGAMARTTPRPPPVARRLDIDVHKNEPSVLFEAQEQNEAAWRGSEISVVIEGSWTKYRARVLKYLRQIAVITPYAQFTLDYRSPVGEGKSDFRAAFKRRTDKMPEPPRETKHHPAAVDLETLRRVVAGTKQRTLLRMLSRDFDCITRPLAERICAESRGGVDQDMEPGEMTDKQTARLHQLLHEVRFPDPRGDHLSPAGEYNLHLGVMKELRPEMVATSAGAVGAHEGHAFMVEAAVSLGGRDVKPGLNIFRFANRIPLLFEGGSDVISQTATNRVNWASYKINQSTDRVGVFVSIVSSKIPFKGAGKEYIADDVEVLRGAVKSAIQACCVQLKQKIARQQALRDRTNRKKNLSKYIPNATAAIFAVLQRMAGVAGGDGDDDDNGDAGGSATARAKRQRVAGLGGEAGQLLREVAAGTVNEEVLSRKLHEHVDRTDLDAALEFQVAQGMGAGMQRDLFLVPRGGRHELGPSLHGTGCVLRLLAGAVEEPGGRLAG